jgi:hypothetical protein
MDWRRSAEAAMKQFLIKYQLKVGTEAQRRDEMVAFIAAMNGDPAVKGRISYRCMKVPGKPDYWHIVTAEDDAVKALQGREYFKRYTELTKHGAGGEVEVIPLELVADTAP